MAIKISVLREDWADPLVPLPAYQTVGSAGADICANLPVEMRAAGFVLQPMERAIVPTGLRVAIPEGFEMQIRPRSGLALKHGITLPNTPGTIDSDYRGPLGVALVNLGAAPYVAPVLQAGFEVVEELDVTARGAGGFGSTGTR